MEDLYTLCLLGLFFFFTVGLARLLGGPPPRPDRDEPSDGKNAGDKRKGP